MSWLLSMYIDLLQYKIEVNFTREFVIQSINNGSNSHQKRATDDKYNFTVTPKKLTKLISPVRKNNMNQSSISLYF